MLEQLRHAFRFLNDAAPKHRRLYVSEHDVALVSAKSSRELWRVRWTNVTQIVAFKVDAITMDHICIGLRENGEAEFHVTDEETPGWDLLVEHLASRFGVVQSSWLAKIALPPFAENFTVLWPPANSSLHPT